jgi:hypothetical protein
VFSYNFLFALEVSWVIFNLEMLKNRINIDIIKIPNKNIRRRLYFLLKKNIRVFTCHFLRVEKLGHFQFTV